VLCVRSWLSLNRRRPKKVSTSSRPGVVCFVAALRLRLLFRGYFRHPPAAVLTSGVQTRTSRFLQQVRDDASLAGGQQVSGLPKSARDGRSVHENGFAVAEALSLVTAGLC
jgi:hypothetical protein